MPGKRGFALLCCTLALLHALQQLPSTQAKRRPAHSHHHSTEAAGGREQKAFELPGGGHLEEDEGEEEELSSIVPLEAAEQHFSLMPDRPAVEEEDDAEEVASPLSQLGEVGAPAKGAYGVFGHHKAGKSGLPHCTAEGMGQVRLLPAFVLARVRTAAGGVCFRCTHAHGVSMRHHRCCAHHGMHARLACGLSLSA